MTHSKHILKWTELHSMHSARWEEVWHVWWLLFLGESISPYLFANKKVQNSQMNYQLKFMFVIETKSGTLEESIFKITWMATKLTFPDWVYRLHSGKYMYIVGKTKQNQEAECGPIITLSIPLQVELVLVKFNILLISFFEKCNNITCMFGPCPTASSPRWLMARQLAGVGV